MLRFSRLFAALLFFNIFFYDAPAQACSICRGGDQAFFLNNARLLPQGKWIFALENLYITKTALHVHPDYHRHGPYRNDSPTVLQDQSQYGIQAVLNYGVSDRVMVTISVPYVFNRFEQGRDNFQVKGLSDPEILAIAHLGSFFEDAVSLAATAGVRLPFGKTDCFDNYGFMLQPHDQIGTGAAAGIVGIQLNYLNSFAPLFFGASYEASGTNSSELRHGDVVRLNLAGQRRLSSRLHLIAELNLRRAEYDVQSATRIEHSGGTTIYFSPGFRLMLVSGLAFRGQVQTPVIENLNGVQNEKTNFRAGLVWAL
jgi:hypothetical protein